MGAFQLTHLCTSDSWPPAGQRALYHSIIFNSPLPLSSRSVTEVPPQPSHCTTHHLPQWARSRMKQQEAEMSWEYKRGALQPSHLPAASAPSPGTLFWVRAGAASLTPCTWTASSWFVKNAEHRSVSRAWSFSKEFCQQKQNIRLAKEMPDTQRRVRGSHKHLSPAPAGGQWKPPLLQTELAVPESDTRYPTCSLFLPHLNPNVYGLSVTHGTGDFVSKTRCPQRTNLRQYLLPGCFRLYALQAFHSLCWHQEQMTLSPSQATIHKSQHPCPAKTAADCSAQSSCCRGRLATRSCFRAPLSTTVCGGRGSSEVSSLTWEDGSCLLPGTEWREWGRWPWSQHDPATEGEAVYLTARSITSLPPSFLI